MKHGPQSIALVFSLATLTALAACASNRRSGIDAKPLAPVDLGGLLHVPPPEGKDWMPVLLERQMTYSRGNAGGTALATASVTEVPVSLGLPDLFVYLRHDFRSSGMSHGAWLDTAEVEPRVRYTYQQFDERVPGHVGERFVFRGWGYLMFHPDSAGVIIRCDFSDRRRADAPPADSLEAHRFLAGVTTR